jgi:hypothetical protein
MRVMCFLSLFSLLTMILAGCTSRQVRCDRHLQRINPPIAGAAVLPRGAP